MRRSRPDKPGTHIDCEGSPEWLSANNPGAERCAKCSHLFVFWSVSERDIAQPFEYGERKPLDNRAEGLQVGKQILERVKNFLVRTGG